MRSLAASSTILKPTLLKSWLTGLVPSTSHILISPKLRPMPGILNLMLVQIMAEQAELNLALQSSIRDVITRIEKLSADDVLRTFD